MFFLRNIHRRLVTGFSLALLLSIALAGVGAVGLLWHQGAIEDLEYVMNDGPDHLGLTQSFYGIHWVAEEPIDGNEPAEVAQLHQDFVAAVRSSRDKLIEFESDINDMQLRPTGESRLLLGQRGMVLKHIEWIGDHLGRLIALGGTLKQIPQLPEAERPEQLRIFRTGVRDVVDGLFVRVYKLPAFQDPQYVTASLIKEKRQSRRLLFALAGIGAGTMVSIIIMWYCGFQWVSKPLKEISDGASRIAEGDPDFRVPPVSRWQDEFSQLRTNVNLMADRFQQAEQDLNRKVRERSQQLVRSERLAGLGFLAAGVAHEINNPLSIIRVAADTLDYRLHENLDDANPERDEIFERLKMVRMEAARCGEITARILDFARGDQAAPQVEDLTAVVDSVLAMVRPMPNYRDREIVFERTQPLRLMMNGAQMKQVMLNLIFNALQATAEGGRVEVRLIEQCDWVVVEVEDDGCGMSEETMEQLFEPFYSTKPTGQGTGLGMCITHRIIEDHQGTIEPLSPGDGQGSLFRIRLPLRQAGREVA